MRTPLNLQLDIELVNAIKLYAQSNNVSVTRILQEVICQFLGIKGAINKELRTAIEERIARRPGRPRAQEAQKRNGVHGTTTDNGAEPAEDAAQTMNAVQPTKNEPDTGGVPLLTKICLRCSEVMNKCSCEQGPEIG